MEATPRGTFSVIEVTRFQAFYAALEKLLNALRPMGDKLKALAKAAVSNARAVFEAEFKPNAFDLGVWLQNLQRNAGQWATKEFAAVLEAYRLMVYWVDKREIATGLAAEWTTSYAYRKIAPAIGLEKWMMFVKWCESWIPTYGRKKVGLSAKGVVVKKLVYGGMSILGIYTGPPGVDTAVLAGNLTKLQGKITFGKAGKTYVSAKWSHSATIALGGIGVFSVQSRIP